jgi:predicted secreted hydrolase
MRGIIVLLAVLVFASVTYLLLMSEPTSEDPSTTLSVTSALGADTVGYRRADRVIPIVFPRDHGAHPEFKTEWWYYTGHLEARGGREFGFQFTIFRTALTPPPDTGNDERADRSANGVSAWRTNQLYTGHLGLTDISQGAFYSEEVNDRGATGLAGSRPMPGKIWVRDWVLHVGEGPSPNFDIRARGEDFSLDLTLVPEKPAVFHGDRGLSPKSYDDRNASYYYSYTRMSARGAIEVGEERLSVSGSAWMDHEWSTSALGEDQIGWDWFSLQFVDGRELMYFRVRSRLPEHTPFVEATLVAPDGTHNQISGDYIQLTELDYWTSPASGVRYPSEWRLEAPALGLTVLITPRLDDQEMNLGVRYWEGAVEVRDDSDRPVGRGYVEMTGHDEDQTPQGDEWVAEE